MEKVAGIAAGAALMLACVADTQRVQAAPVGTMYFSQSTDARISKADTDGTGYQTVFSRPMGSFLPRGVAVDEPSGHLYWVDFNTGRIERSDLDGANPQIVLQSTFPSDLVLDQTGGMIYYTAHTDSPYSQIRRVKPSGAGDELLVTTTSFADGITVDPIGGKVYWSTYHDVQRSNLDGSNVETLFSRVHDGNSGLALDLASGKLYVSDWERIHVSDLDGSNRQSFIVEAWAYVNRIALNPVDGKLYWTRGTTSPTGRIQRSNPDGTGIEDVLTGLTYPYGIAVFPEPATLTLLALGGLAVTRRQR